MKFNEVKNSYMNRAGALMESYFSDLYHDVKMIENMKKGNICFFLIQPNCTHSAKEDNYDEIRDLCAQFWGNYVIIRIEKVDDDHFTATTEVELSDMFYTWVFGFGRRAKILEPAYVVDKMREYCQKVADMY